jgi:DNA-binding transcriptional MerR regulator
MTQTKIPAEPRPFSTRDVLEQTGLTFRVLDYWLRTGVIALDDPTPGSGMRRRYTEAEMAAIKRIIDRYQTAMAEIEAVRSGQAWADEIEDADSDREWVDPTR